MEWIDVNNRLPNKKENVIFWVKYKGSVWHAKTGWMKQQSDGHLFIIPTPHDCKGRIVSHWMLLPEPPKVT